MGLVYKPVLFLWSFLFKFHEELNTNLEKQTGVITMPHNRAIVSVVGKDQVGIIAKVTTVLAENNVNVLDISQTILQDFFTMMMLVEINKPDDLENLAAELNKVSSVMNLKIDMQREELFQSMHRI
jgi:ACT domain-containing protein